MDAITNKINEIEKNDVLVYGQVCCSIKSHTKVQKINEA